MADVNRLVAFFPWLDLTAPLVCADVTIAPHGALGAYVDMSATKALLAMLDLLRGAIRG